MRKALVLLAGALCVAALPAPGAAQQPTVDVQSYHFRIDLPDTGTVIHGIASIFFETRAGYDDTLRLDLVGMSVRRVFDIHTMRQLPMIHDGRVLKITTRSASTQRPRGVVVEYRGSPQDGLIIRTNARGRRAAFGDNWPNRARYWLPTIDHPSDKARVLWSIQVPRGWVGVANQPECQTVSQGARRVRRCNESRAIPTYTMVLGATEMTRSIHRPLISGRDTISMEVWAYPEDSAFADSVPFRRITQIAEVLQRIVGPFPYGRLSHVQSSTRYGGMENSTVIFYSENAIARRTLREGTVRHETAHQWFGDAVTAREWAHVWLSEGFATYFNLVAGAALDGDSVLQAGMRGAAETVKRAEVINRPVIDSGIVDPNRLLNANSYQKGAWVLHMLRGFVGDSTFFRGIRTFYSTYRDSSVMTQQFQRVMERASGDSLGWFFNQWLRQPGYPRLEIGWEPQPQSVVLRIRQAQPAAWGRFTLPMVPVLLVFADGRVERRSFRLDARYPEQTHTFMLNSASQVTEVVVDPDDSLLLEATLTRTPL